MNDEQLAMAIGNAVLDAIKTYQPEPKIIEHQPDYMTPKQLASEYGKTYNTIRTIVAEIKEQIQLGRYPSNAVLEGCGLLVNVDVFRDYLKYRKQLKDPVARKYVEEYEEETL